MHNALFQLRKIISIDNAVERAQQLRKWEQSFVVVYKGDASIDERALDYARPGAREELVLAAQRELLYGFARENLPIEFTHDHDEGFLGRVLRLHAEAYILRAHPDAESTTPKKDSNGR